MRLVTALAVVGIVTILFSAGCDKPQQPVAENPPVGAQTPPDPEEMGGPLPPGADHTATTPPGGDLGPITPPPGDTAGGRTYTVKPKDGVMSIARTQLGNAHRWKEIIALNPEIQPPDYKLRIGQVIKLPAK